MSAEMTGHDLFAAIQRELGPEARRHRGVDAPTRRDLAPAGGSYRAIGALVDGIRAGDGDVPLTGVFVCARASMAVLEQAVALGANCVISRSAFLGDSQDRPVSKPEPALAAKLDYVAAHRLMVLRLQDVRTAPTGMAIVTALAGAAGLGAPLPADDPAAGLVWRVKAASLGQWAGRFRKALGGGPLRLVGDPDLAVTGIAMATETSRPNALNPLIARPDVNLLVCGEVHETETTAYVLDAIALGQHKALLIAGSVAMEDAAARRLAQLLPAITKVPVHYVPVSDGIFAAR